MVNLTSAGDDEDENTNDEDGDDVDKQQTALFAIWEKRKPSGHSLGRSKGKRVFLSLYIATLSLEDNLHILVTQEREG